MIRPQQRSLKNYLINPNFQIKYALYFATSGMAMMGLLFTLITSRLSDAVAAMGDSNLDSLGLESAISLLIFDVSLFCVIGFFLNIIFSFAFAIYMTHRVAGPGLVIERYIAEIKAGEYDSTRTLRKSDDLQAIMSALRDLAAHLKSKSKP